MIRPGQDRAGSEASAVLPDEILQQKEVKATGRVPPVRSCSEHLDRHAGNGSVNSIRGKQRATHFEKRKTFLENRWRPVRVLRYGSGSGSVRTRASA